MKLFPKIVMLIAGILAISWFLPWLYALCFPTPSGQPFCTFSPVNNHWIASSSRPGEKPVIEIIDSIDENGYVLATTAITRDDRDSLVPQLYYKQLVASNRLADTIAGIAVTPHALRQAEIMLTSSPREVVKRQPGVWLMMESMPSRVDLEDANQVFRFTSDGRMEFVDMATNEVNEIRSRRFTDLMQYQGFAYPAKDLSANVTARKNYDEGYLMVDAKGHIFHVKQQAGRPYVAAIPMPDSIKAEKVFILEEMDRSVLGLVIDTEKRLWMLQNPYKLVPLPIDNVDASRDAIMMMSSLFGTVFRFSDKGVNRWYAVAPASQGYELLGHVVYKSPRTLQAAIADFLFPYALTFTSSADSLAYPRIIRLSAWALILNVILAGGMGVMAWRRRSIWLTVGAVITLPLGIFAFVPFLLLDD